MRHFWFASLLLVLGGCGSSASGGDGGEGVAAVQPSQVTPEALRAAASDPRLVAFYQARDWAPAWNAETAAALVESIETGAVNHALDPAAFLAAAGRDPAPAAREAALSLAALEYGDALARGMVDPEELRDIYELPRPEANVAAGLNQALAEGDVGSWFDGLAPQDAEYRLLSQAYVAAARAAGDRSRQPIPGGDAIEPGASDPRIPAIVAALRRTGYLSAEPAPSEDAQAEAAPPAPTRYGPQIVEAVRRLQQDHGLEPDGNIGEETLAAINGGAFERARKLAVNLERRRWLARRTAPTRVDVNIAAAELSYWRDGARADRRKVITGQPGNETPQLHSPIYRLVANPTWTVPRSIAEEEIEPKGEGYLRRNNMVRRDGMIVQLSGPDNSLGLVKFDMKNDHAIYLHDTPAKSLFARDQRHFSHGCVRVEDALGFARMIARQEGVLAEWQEALATGEETFVPLPREIPVRLLYHTAFVEGGRVAFRPDVYGWDEDIAEALGLAARPRRPRPVHTSDIGP